MVPRTLELLDLQAGEMAWFNTISFVTAAVCCCSHDSVCVTSHYLRVFADVAGHPRLVPLVAQALRVVLPHRKEPRAWVAHHREEVVGNTAGCEEGAQAEGVVPADGALPLAIIKELRVLHGRAARFGDMYEEELVLVRDLRGGAGPARLQPLEPRLLRLRSPLGLVDGDARRHLLQPALPRADPFVARVGLSAHPASVVALLLGKPRGALEGLRAHGASQHEPNQEERNHACVRE